MNRANVPMSLGKRGNSAVYYCGRKHKALSAGLTASGDGRCGPHNGEQCPDCLDLNIYSVPHLDGLVLQQCSSTKPKVLLLGIVRMRDSVHRNNIRINAFEDSESCIVVTQARTRPGAALNYLHSNTSFSDLGDSIDLRRSWRLADGETLRTVVLDHYHMPNVYVDRVIGDGLIKNYILGLLGNYIILTCLHILNI